MPVLGVLILAREAELRSRIEAAVSRRGDLRVIGSEADIASLGEALQRRPAPDVLLVHIDQPEFALPLTWARLRALLPHSVPLVTLTRGADLGPLQAALAAGVAALQRPEVEPEALCDVILKAVRGELVFSEDLAAQAREALLEPESDTIARVGGLTIDRTARQVKRWGIEVPLSELEFELIVYLAARRGRPAPWTELLAQVWRTNPEQGGTADQVRSCVKRLRAKIEPDRRRPRYLLYVRSQGYVLSNFLVRTSG